MSAGDFSTLSGATLGNKPHCLRCFDEATSDGQTYEMVFLFAEHRLLVCVHCKRTLERANEETGAKPR